MNFFKTRKGFGLIEVLIGVTIISISVISLTAAFHRAVRLHALSVRSVQAAFLIEEGVEVVKSIRAESWEDRIAPLLASTTYYITFNGSLWQATTTQSVIDGIFYRTITFHDVYRNATTEDIAVSGTLDEGTKKLVVTVSWLEGSATSTRSLSTYISNILLN